MRSAYRLLPRERLHVNNSTGHAAGQRTRCAWGGNRGALYRNRDRTRHLRRVECGELGARMRGHDWSTSPLGTPAHWPQSLKTAVRIMLNSRYPMFVWWGEELINLYNDAYVSVLGQRHPSALGRPAREVWYEIWDLIGAQSDLNLKEGKASWHDKVLLIMERNGYPEETYFTFSHSPIPDDDGGNGGEFCSCT